MQYIHSKLVGSLNMPILFFWFSNIKDNLSRPLQSWSNRPNSNTDKHNMNKLNRPYSSKTFLPPQFATLADSLYATQLLKERKKTTPIPIRHWIFQGQCRNAWEGTRWVSQFVNVCGISVWRCSHAARRHAPTLSGSAGPPWTPAVARMAFSALTLFVRVPRKPQHSALLVSSRMPSGCQVLATKLSANLSVALESGLINWSSVHLLVRLCCRYSCIIWIADGRRCKSVKDFPSSVFMWTSLLRDDDKVHRNFARVNPSKNPAIKFILRDRVCIQAKQPMGQIVSERSNELRI